MPDKFKRKSKPNGPPIILAGKNDPDEKEDIKNKREGMFATNEEAKKDPDGSHKVFDITYHNPGHDDHGKVIATHSTMNLATAAIKKSKGPEARYRAVVRHVDNSNNDQRNKENEFRHRELAVKEKAVKEKLASKKKLKETIERVINEK
jgi:hypothetical protein